MQCNLPQRYYNDVLGAYVLLLQCNKGWHIVYHYQKLQSLRHFQTAQYLPVMDWTFGVCFVLTSIKLVEPSDGLILKDK